MKGFDPRRAGSGRKKGVPQPGKSKAALAASAVVAKGSELAAAALAKMRAEFDAANPQELARFASTSALRLLIDTVNDDKVERSERLAAARTLVSTGWAQAPTQSLHLNANLDRMSDAALAKMLGMPAQAAPRVNVEMAAAAQGLPTKGNPIALVSIGEPQAPSERPLNGTRQEHAA